MFIDERMGRREGHQTGTDQNDWTKAAMVQMVVILIFQNIDNFSFKCFLSFKHNSVPYHDKTKAFQT